MPKTATNKTARKTKTPSRLGDLPEWNLKDLYPAIDSPELKWDLENAETRCVEFETDFKGKLASLAAGPNAGQALAADERPVDPFVPLCAFNRP